MPVTDDHNFNGTLPEQPDGKETGCDTDAIHLRTARWCGVATLLLGLWGILGWIIGLRALLSIMGYQPIVISTSLAFIILGGVQFTTARPQLPQGVAIALMVFPVLIAIFSLLEIVELVTGASVSIEDAILRHYPALYFSPISRIAPATSVFIFCISLLLMLHLYQHLIGRRPRIACILMGGVGSLIVLVSAMFILGYIYQAPLLYGSSYIPISLLASLAVVISGLGLVNLAGSSVFPLSWLTGTSTRAQLFRAFLPLTSLLLLLLSYTQYSLTRLTRINPAIVTVVLVTLFEIIIGIALLQVARLVGNQIDRVEKERLQAVKELRESEDALRRLTETLEQRVQERTEQLREAFEREQTARREAETAQAYFQGLLESAPDGIVIVDAEGRITLVNNQTEQLSGYTRDELLDKLVEILIPERYGEIHLKHRSDFMAAPRTRPMGVGLDLFLRRKDGVEVPVEISLSPFRAPGGMRVTASIRDITARKQIEAEIQRLNSELQMHVEQLKVTNKELEAFSYSVSHDLRAPLRSIDGFSKILLERYQDQLDDRGQDYLNRVRAASQRMARLIDDMLNLSRIGRAEMHHETVNLADLASAVIDELRQREPERQVEVVIQPDLEVQGDAALLRIVLVNLLSNAWKFTGKRERARMEVGQEIVNNERLFYVRDNGAGFDMAYADKLFSPFQRLHTEEEFPGTGIGLAIVQRIIIRHGGRVWAEGAEDQGATFYFTLGE